jgi:hypothetical protein
MRRALSFPRQKKGAQIAPGASWEGTNNTYLANVRKSMNSNPESTAAAGSVPYRESR